MDFRHNFIVEIKSKEQIKELLCKTLPRNSSLPALGPPLIAVKRITLLSQLKISHWDLLEFTFLRRGAFSAASPRINCQVKRQTWNGSFRIRTQFWLKEEEMCCKEWRQLTIWPSHQEKMWISWEPSSGDFFWWWAVARHWFPTWPQWPVGNFHSPQQYLIVPLFNQEGPFVSYTKQRGDTCPGRLVCALTSWWKHRMTEQLRL